VAALFNLDATPGKTCAGYCGLWVQINDATFQVVPITLGKYGELYPTVSSVSMNGFYFEPHLGLPIFMASGHADHQRSEISGVYFPMLELAIGSDQSRFLMDGWSDKTCGRCGPKGGEGAFIYGVTPTLSALQSNIGGITAHYQGGTIYGGQIVHINVTLNSGVWDGSWSNGFAPTAFAFDANGTISGVNLTSTNLSGENVKGNPTTYTGSVNGAFFGTNAQTVGGVADVTRTVSFEGEGSDTTRHVDLFVTTNLLPPVEK